MMRSAFSCFCGLVEVPAGMTAEWAMVDHLRGVHYEPAGVFNFGGDRAGFLGPDRQQLADWYFANTRWRDILATA